MSLDLTNLSGDLDLDFFMEFFLFLRVDLAYLLDLAIFEDLSGSKFIED